MLRFHDPKMQEAYDKAGLGLQNTATVATAVIGCIPALTVLVLNAFTLPVEVFIRHKFGIRYVSPLRILTVLVILCLIGPIQITLLMYPAVAGDVPEGTFGQLLGTSVAFILLYLVVATCQYISAHRRMRRGEPWHSLSDGEPLGIWRVIGIGRGRYAEWEIRQFLEPLLVAGVGICSCLVGPTVGVYLVLAAVVLAVKTMVEYTQGRNKLLDIVDGRIEAEAMSRAVGDPEARRMQGFLAQGISPRSTKDRESMARILQTLDPELAAIMDPNLKPISFKTRTKSGSTDHPD